jgi:hypothetical protein
LSDMGFPKNFTFFVGFYCRDNGIVTKFLCIEINLRFGDGM